MTTPPGRGGISVVELHGAGAATVVAKRFRPRRSGASIDSGKPLYGHIMDGRGRIIDEVIVRRAPPGESLTGLGCVEVHCHGGPAPVRGIIALLVAEGASEVRWKGLVDVAHRNGAIDAIRCEAIKALPFALTPLAARVLNDQWRGALSDAVRSLRSPAEARRLAATASLGKALVTPLRVAIVGPPNAGKSTLLNALLETDRALVHDEPGTTRDPVKGTIAVEGVPFTLIDTAGIGSPRDAIDLLGQERTREELEDAEIVVTVADATSDLPPPDVAGKKVIALLNKIDLRERERSGCLRVSALKKIGIDALREAILDSSGLRGLVPLPGAPVVFTERQERLLARLASGEARERTIDRLLADVDESATRS
ncbi:MAG: hypothetical protein A2Z34_09000 [Planctomycetes bacterium RBG_16_59_8]|nr:MAG: hypothetical protein A2Z34_09000 [Planctomycetes bacterium RBG_16_59_8]